MVTKRISYLCEICDTQFATKGAAEACEAAGLEDAIVQVGDIVLLKEGFGWFDGDPKWVSNLEVLSKPKESKCKGNCFNSCCTLSFYYVVTKVEKSPDNGHRTRYHCFTKAMVGGYRDGWTQNRTHYTPRLVEKPPAYVVEDSADLIGQAAEHLL